MRLAVTIFAALVLLFPVYYMAQGSFQDIQGVLSVPPRLAPKTPTLDNYELLFSQPGIGRWALNSLVAFVGYVGGSIVVNGTAGYAFSFARFPGKGLLYGAFLAALMISRVSIIIPQFVLTRQIGLIGMPAVILMTAFSPAFIFLFRSYFDTIPRSLVECARIDGAGDGRIFTRIILPLSGPIVGAVVVMRGVEALSDYIWQMLNLTADKSKTLLVGLTQAIHLVRMGRSMKDIGFELAVGMVLLVPLILIFALSSRYFIEGITLGGVKE